MTEDWKETQKFIRNHAFVGVDFLCGLTTDGRLHFCVDSNLVTYEQDEDGESATITLSAEQVHDFINWLIFAVKSRQEDISALNAPTGSVQ